MDFLKALFGDSALTFDQLASAIQEHNGKAENKEKQIKIGNIGDGSYVSSDKFKAKETELATANTTIKNLQGEIKKWDGVDVETLRTAAANWETKYTQDTAKIRTDSAVEIALMRAKAKNPKAARALLDESKIKLDGDKVLGLDDQLEALKKSDAYLFDVEAPAGADPAAGGFTPPAGGAPKGSEFNFGFTTLKDMPKQ
ncbi:phage scaffolding protein [Holdemania massiliensis]|uniref:phage scaffolding protein n=1 Tax=Holdemania massiliensis TaxID=1468449 RepID=UPI001F06A9C9|nr:phage scaffolding protein [Holdemania massiliensis]MCH1941596.1 phage scaffolding protein [Holdemania massiliensis]